MTKKDRRINKIIEILKEKNGLSIRELASALGVSEMTIRRDLNSLSIDNIVNVVHGAAIYNSEYIHPDNKKYNITAEKVIMDSEKDRIGKAAAELIEKDDTIIIDTGTTTEKLTKYIPLNFPVTVICYNMNTLIEINKKNVEKLILLGGYYHPNTQMFESIEGIELIKKTRANKLFLSAAGISSQLELTCVEQYEVNTKIASINSSLTKILLIDSSKFNKLRPAYFATLDCIDIVITDTGIPDNWKDIINDMGIDLHIV